MPVEMNTVSNATSVSRRHVGQSSSSEAEPLRVLALDPGTKELGFASFEDDHLVDYGVKQIRQSGGVRAILMEVKDVVSRLIREKQPQVLVMEQNRFSEIRMNVRLSLSVATIRVMAKQNGIKVLEFDPRTIRKVVAKNGNCTKRELARTVAVHYPEMRQFLQQDRRFKERFHQNSFDAVACGLAYLASDEAARIGQKRAANGKSPE